MAFKLVDVTLSTDTNAYASGDVIADTQAFYMPAPEVKLVSLVLTDSDDQGVALFVHFLQGSGTMGTENAAPSISDANNLFHLGVVSIAAADYQDVGAARVATKTNIQQILQTTSPLTGYVAVVNSTGTPTYTAAGLKLRLGLEW